MALSRLELNRDRARAFDFLIEPVFTEFWAIFEFQWSDFDRGPLRSGPWTQSLTITIQTEI